MTDDELVNRMTANERGMNGGPPAGGWRVRPDGSPAPAGKALAVRWYAGEKVRPADGDPLRRGWVVAIHHNPGNATYTVSWADGSDETTHYAFELDDAE